MVCSGPTSDGGLHEVTLFSCITYTNHTSWVQNKACSARWAPHHPHDRSLEKAFRDEAGG